MTLLFQLCELFYIVLMSWVGIGKVCFVYTSDVQEIGDCGYLYSF